MGTLEIVINGVKVDVAPGTTILQAAAQVGVDIPALCYDPRLRPFGACRMCLVEVAGARGPVAACTTPVRGGMVVTTNGGEVEGLRRTALEFLLAEHHGDCEAPCHVACPAGIDIQGFIALIADGRDADSLRLIKEALPFPATCGRVCPRFCEQECRRNVVDEPVAICHLKRYVADSDLESGAPYMPAVAEPSGKTVGVVGGGPAGLTAAYYLAIAGHAVSIYEACAELGGMLRYAIPEYRLPKEVLDREIATITRLCHEVRCNTKLGRDVSLEELQARHDAVIVAVGAASSQMTGVQGENLPGSYGGLDFLAEYTMGASAKPIGRRVAVIGGGNTAIDCARTALRQGAEEVTIVYRRGRSEMPASHEEIEGAEEEGVRFRFLTAPVACACTLDSGERIGVLTCCEMALGEPDASGRRRPQPVPGSEFGLDVDTVIWATGQMLNKDGLAGLELTRNGWIKADSRSATSVANVFATADCVTGPTTVVEACGAAHKTALLVDAYLGGREMTLPAEPYNHIKGELAAINRAEYADQPKIGRERVELRDPHRRARDFVEIDPGHTTAQAAAEVRRCMACGCQDVHDCLLREYATEYHVKQPRGLRAMPMPVRADHELVVRDPNKCILCGNCVRICAEVTGASALGFVARGFKVVVEPTLERALAETPCESCGQCISACPTGALTASVALAKPGPFALERTASVCAECSVGCELAIGTHANLLVDVMAPLDAAVNSGNLCKRGSLLPKRLADLAGDRVTQPMARVNGELQAVSWEDALNVAAAELRAVKASAGGGGVIAYVSTRSTTEEAALARQVAGVALGGAKATSGLPRALPAVLATLGAAPGTFQDIANADLILTVEADLADRYPVAAIKVRQALERGARLVSLASREARLDRLAAPAIRAARGELADKLSCLMTAPATTAKCCAASESCGGHELAGVAAALAGAKRPVIVVGADDLSEAEAATIAGLARVGAGSRVLCLTAAGNARGLVAAGLGPVSAAGDHPLAAVVAALGLSLDLDGYGGTIVVGSKLGVEGCRDGDPFVLCVVPYLTAELRARANVVLPGSTLLESSGTLVNSEARQQPARRALRPANLDSKDTSDALVLLAARLGCDAAGLSPSVAGQDN
jgi:formate dehydrogenase major subunit